MQYYVDILSHFMRVYQNEIQRRVPPKAECKYEVISVCFNLFFFFFHEHQYSKTRTFSVQFNTMRGIYRRHYFLSV